ncbi:DDHD protein [Venustampulla echinocandica]|uniref:DDHD protein n=1 Tax=Venustampulla echinocandica TaxID=2656787 RepID=A0A370TPA4_9HELO|nr:DDHD protein [Venustampulla echinocandica]RDL37356.1 DDHD protein [Venustampulla echinocandica]
MSHSIHTYGPTCRLTGNVALSNSRNDDDIPYLKAQFFYSSPLPIDDPLSVVPPPQSGSDVKSAKHPLRPFSAYDNNALEEAWMGVASPRDGDSKTKSTATQLAGKDGKEGHPARVSTLVTEHARRSRSDSLGESSRNAISDQGGFKQDVARDTRLRERFEGREDRRSSSQPVGSTSSSLPSQSGTGTTGQPFIKFDSAKDKPKSRYSWTPTRDLTDNSGYQSDSRETGGSGRASPETSEAPTSKMENDYADVPVGISRLHLVKVPALQMHPIYWSPVHDLAAVTRGTWFYKDSMYPVEPAVANQLEFGYRELRPWSKTWNDELNSAIYVGAAGEEKIAHRLWPQEIDSKRNSQISSGSHVCTDPYSAAECFPGEAAAEGTIDLEKSQPKPATKRYSSAQVIYKDAQSAFILKPTLQPSAYYGRKPLQKIKRGMTVGIHVVRGFDWKMWEKLHPSKKRNNTKAAELAPVSGDADAAKNNACSACRAQEERPKVTDLVLVIHGIGQKLSERVESFHFTHAINTFRRSINVELANENVQRVLRKDLDGIMALPVNWRSNLSFEDGGPRKDGDEDRFDSEFSLKDITPNTIPAVRNLISDVMLDIPFYMSHHKPKMIQAVISEANRVYGLWCRNNPEFHREGRVHIIAHSLGSAMAVEILSNQPTTIPRIQPHSNEVNTKHFDFNTTNVFFAGSPAGFFLLLEKGKLVPRRGQCKPGAEPGDDQDKDIVGEVGTFGCIAVDNIYNIMHYNDPIAYRLNATADPQYAASLKDAQVPSATASFFQSIGNAMRSITPGMAAPGDLAVGQVPRPPAIARLPSQLELEVHDFTREEIAEKVFFLLNDNGQVDWFLSSGGGPLEIQYLNMLSAHSSYWGSSDFIRMIVTEVGRQPGKNHVLPNMKAVKVSPRDSRR